MKINMIERDKNLGGRYVIVPVDNDQKMTRLGFKKLDATKEKVAEMLEEGHSFIQLGENIETAMVYVSTKSNGLINDVGKWLENNEWNTNMRLNNYEESQEMWAYNVAAWFDAAKHNDKFVTLVQALVQEAVDTPSVPHWKTGVLNPPFVLKEKLQACQKALMETKAPKGSTGKRPEVVFQYLSNWLKSESDSHIHSYLVKNDKDYKERYWKQYKTLAFKKGRKLPR